MPDGVDLSPSNQESAMSSRGLSLRLPSQRAFCIRKLDRPDERCSWSAGRDSFLMARADDRVGRRTRRAPADHSVWGTMRPAS